MSIKTVEKHCQNLMNKLDIHVSTKASPATRSRLV
ncbi:MAG: hypothetical protein ACSHX7_00195 [Luteolibacter sp.]